MKIVRFLYKSNLIYGVLKEKNIYPIDKIPWLINNQILEEPISIDKVTLMSPCMPQKVLCVALNYPGITGASSKDEEPFIFLKPGSSVIGPSEDIIIPFKDTNVWGESELGIVIGKKLKNVNSTQAIDGIYGFCCANDVSASNINNRDHHLAKSKAADSFCVLGPWIDTKFEPSTQRIRAYHNQSLLRDGNLDCRFYDDIEIIMWLSSWITLEPGDVILTGAPSRIREREFFNHGDSFHVSIDGLGEITNNVFFK